MCEDLLVRSSTDFFIIKFCLKSFIIQLYVLTDN